MAAPKRSNIQRERDLAIVTRWYCRGLTQQEIVDRLNARDDVSYALSRRSVGYDLAKVRKRWLEASISSYDERMAEALARNDELERTYYEAWEQSLKSHETKTTKVASPDDAGGKVKMTAGQTVIESSLGNIEYLKGVERCLDRRIELLGLSEPLKVAHTDPTGQKPVDDNTRVNRLAELLGAVVAQNPRVLELIAAMGEGEGDGTS